MSAAIISFPHTSYLSQRCNYWPNLGLRLFCKIYQGVELGCDSFFELYPNGLGERVLVLGFFCSLMLQPFHTTLAYPCDFVLCVKNITVGEFLQLREEGEMRPL